MDITFYIPEQHEIDKVLELESGKDDVSMYGEENWLIKTCLILRFEGVALNLSQEVPDEGILVYQSKHAELIRKTLKKERKNKSILVEIVSNKSRSYVADFKVSPSWNYRRDRKQIYIPPWSTPGLEPNKKTKREVLKVIAFIGDGLKLDSFFFSKEWEEWIRAHDMIFYHENNSQADLFIAAPSMSSDKGIGNNHSQKQISLLYDGWTIGVPVVILHGEVYREFRKSPLDFIEVMNIEELKEAILKLKRDPFFCSAMVENGFERAREYRNDVITQYWIDFFYNYIPVHSTKLRSNISRRILIHLRILYRAFYYIISTNRNK